MIGIAAAAAAFPRDLEAAFTIVEGLAQRARKQGADLLVLPESALGGYLYEDAGLADLPPQLDLDGPEIARLCRIAGDLVICAGFTETGMHTSAVCVHGDGVLGHQRKVHLPPSERFAFTPGDGFAAFDTPVGRVGMLVCYDKLFPEAARTLVLDGAEIVATLSAWPMDRAAPARRARDDRQTRHFDTIDAARAIENQVVWVSSNLAGRWGRLRFMASAKVVDPDGITRATTGTRAGLAVAHLDVGAEIGAMRAHIDHLADRRPETYVLAEAGTAPPHVRDRGAAWPG